MIVTIDGYAGSGKSAAAARLAAALGFRLLNTGAMYRATAFALTRLGFDLYADNRDVAAIGRTVGRFSFELTDTEVRLNGEDFTPHVFTESMGRHASRVGTFPEVRAALQKEQRRLADDLDVICEGRDQGTVVFPDAPVKFFFTASAEVRARRRAAQEGIEPDPTTLAELVHQIQTRDRQDETRAADPLRQADDAVVIDTTNLSPDEVLARMLDLVTRCRSSR